MPLYMDRHEIAGATAEELAEAHQKDIAVQARHACRAITYWSDVSRGTAFCLIEAPSAAAVREMHSEAHGLLPSQIIEVDPSTVAQFLGRLSDPETADGEPIYDSAFRAIVFVDMVGSTDITKALGDSAALGLVRRYRDVVREGARGSRWEGGRPCRGRVPHKL